MLLPLLALIAVQLLFSGLPVASKFVLKEASPEFVVVLRSAFAALFFGLLCILRSANSRFVFFPRGLRRHLSLLGLAFFGVTLNQMTLFMALPYTSASIASIISPTIAVFTFAFSVALGKERFDRITFFGIVLGSMGVLVVLWPSFFSLMGVTTVSPDGGRWWANGLNVLSAASYAFYLARIGELPSQMGTLIFTFWFFLYGFLLNLLVWFFAAFAGLMRFSGLLNGESWAAVFPQLPQSFWIGLVFLLVGATALTYLLNTWAGQRVKPSLVGGFVCLQTLFGLLGASWILKETLTPVLIFGSLFILSGVVLLAFSAKEQHTSPTMQQ
ncbi:MAG: DMT family transporter [Betaproteobacteria bacterium]|nr:DMT family transporter [Betaproteobacteria bacterium]